MSNVEFVSIVFDILGTALFITSAVLSIAFMLRRREARWRWLPCISIIALPIIALLPESGWSDIRSQWHEAALARIFHSAVRGWGQNPLQMPDVQEVLRWR
jgi:hypothetical protein